jgi:excisionase family DNA binding protein
LADKRSAAGRHEDGQGDGRFLSVAEIATHLGVKHQAVRRAISRGELPAAKVCSRVRIARADFDAWVRDRRITPEHPGDAGKAARPRAAVGLKRHLDAV